jgi:hypothetical protein
MEAVHHDVSSLAAHSQLKVGLPHSLHQLLYAYTHSLLLWYINHCRFFIELFPAWLLSQKGKVCLGPELDAFLAGELTTG